MEVRTWVVGVSLALVTTAAGASAHVLEKYSDLHYGGALQVEMAATATTEDRDRVVRVCGSMPGVEVATVSSGIVGFELPPADGEESDERQRVAIANCIRRLPGVTGIIEFM